MIKSVILSFILCLIINPTLLSQDWKKEYDKDGLIIHTRKPEGSDIKEYKSEITVNANLENCISLMSDIDLFPDFMYSVEVANLYKKESEREFTVYYEIGLPWPFDNRYAIYTHILTKNEDNSYSLSIRNADVEGYDSELKKMEGNTIVYWEFIPLDKEKTKIIHGSRSSGMPFPKWLINMFITESPKYTLGDFKTIIEKKN